MSLEIQIQEAKDAYHQLVIGHSVVSIQKKDGSRVEYRSTNIRSLQKYIEELELEKLSGPVKRRLPAIRFC